MEGSGDWGTVDYDVLGEPWRKRTDQQLSATFDPTNPNAPYDFELTDDILDVYTNPVGAILV